MGEGHVRELGNAVLGPASGSAQVGGPRMLTQREARRVCLQLRHWYQGPACSSRDSSTSGSLLP